MIAVVHRRGGSRESETRVARRRVDVSSLSIVIEHRVVEKFRVEVSLEDERLVDTADGARLRKRYIWARERKRYRLMQILKDTVDRTQKDAKIGLKRERRRREAQTHV